MELSDNIKNAIERLQKGEIVLIYDSDGREEETDIVVASEFISPDVIHTMRRDGGGLICTTTHSSTAKALGLPYLSDLFNMCSGNFAVLGKLVPNDIPYDEKSTFSLTINHRKTFTGITDIDRAYTISEYAKLIIETSNGGKANAQDLFGERFRAPGHVHLLNAEDGLLSKRRGHTELSTALMLMASLVPSATICEMMASDGGSLKMADSKMYAKEKGLAFLEGREVVEAWEIWSQ